MPITTLVGYRTLFFLVMFAVSKQRTDKAFTYASHASTLTAIMCHVITELRSPINIWPKTCCSIVVAFNKLRREFCHLSTTGYVWHPRPVTSVCRKPTAREVFSEEVDMLWYLRLFQRRSVDYPVNKQEYPWCCYFVTESHWQIGGFPDVTSLLVGVTCFKCARSNTNSYWSNTNTLLLSGVTCLNSNYCS